MRLLNSSDLVQAFRDNLLKSTSVDVAVAWLGASPALEALRAYAATRNARPRICVGLSGNATNPSALRSAQTFADVRVVPGERPLFHPKMYLFGSDRRSLAWIGSANFTASGFGLNRELVCEFEDEQGQALAWFESLWRSLEGLNHDALISAYQANWNGHLGNAEIAPLADDLFEEDDLIWDGHPADWAGYMRALEACDELWREVPGDFRVLRESRSYLETITIGHAISVREDWGNLTLGEVRILLGTDNLTGAWGLLGSMRGAGIARQNFLNNTDNIRQTFRNYLTPVLNSNGEDDFIIAAVNAINNICHHRGFGPAIATRLITLMRPDRGVSVNGASAARLGLLSFGEERTAQYLADPQNYPDLLRWLYSQPWYAANEPLDSYGILIWGMRAALIDSFVYDAGP